MKDKLVLFFRKTDFFRSILNIAWCVIIVIMSVFMNYTHLRFDVPTVFVVLCSVIFIAIELIVCRKLLKNNIPVSDETGTVLNAGEYNFARRMYQIFNYFFPIVMCLIRLVFQDSLYWYGGFMPGMESLGVFVINIAVMVIAVIGCVIFNILMTVKKKRADKPSNTKAVDVLNVVSFIAIVTAIVVYAAGFIISYGVETLNEQKQETAKAYEEEYRKQVLTDLINSDMYNEVKRNSLPESGAEETADTFETAENELLWEGYSYALYTEMLAKDPSLLASDESVGISTVSSEVLLKGKNNYIEFTKKYKPIDKVEMTGQDILYDSENATVSVSSQLTCVDEEENSSVDCFMIVVFDREWKVVNIRCQRERLDQYDRN